MEQFDSENNRRFSAEYLLYKDIIVIRTSEELKQFEGKRCRITPYRHSGHLKVTIRIKGDAEFKLIDRKEYLTMQWVNKENFPEYFL